VETNNLVADARVDGIFRWDLTDPEGDKMTMLGEFRQLVSKSEGCLHLALGR